MFYKLFYIYIQSSTWYELQTSELNHGLHVLLKQISINYSE